MKPRRRLTVAVVTGTRAEFGLLRPVMHAIRKHKKLKLQVIAAGAHFLKPARTIREVEAEFPIAARVPMQRPGRSGRAADALATARGLEGFARAYAKLKPDWVVVLGDRIEAFAAASAASIAGIAVCHIHGGDRAEGLADEAMRHAITKLSHLHCAATKLSAERIVKMGEKPRHVHVTGSPAIDGLAKIRPMGDAEARLLGDPRVVILVHPNGLGKWREWANTHFAYNVAGPIGLDLGGRGSTALWLAPNADPGREFVAGLRAELHEVEPWITLRDHLPRHCFVALLKRLAKRPLGCLIGNSSAGLIECAALGLPVINIGPRQSGRESGPNVLTLMDGADAFDFRVHDPVRLLEQARLHVVGRRARRPDRRFGDGRAGPRIAALLAATDPHDPALLRKHNTY